MGKKAKSQDLPVIEMKTRLFVRKLGGDYLEVAGVESFERSDDEAVGGEISFVISPGQAERLSAALIHGVDRYVDVKMEISVGMVMKFSGYVEEIDDTRVCFAIATPIVPDIFDAPDDLTMQ
jgi:hypothetical protein